MSFDKLKKLEEKVSEAARILGKLRKEKATIEARCNDLQEKLSRKEAELKAIKSQTDQFEPIIEGLIKKLENLGGETAPLEEARAKAKKPALEEVEIEEQMVIKGSVAEYQGHFDLGNVYEEKGMYEEAIEEYRKAIALNPDYIEAVEHLAFLLEKLDRESEATPLWEKVLEFKKPR